MTNPPKPHDRRCAHCGRLLGRYMLVPGSRAEVRCIRCGWANTWVTPLDSNSISIVHNLVENLNGNTPPETYAELYRLAECILDKV